MNRIVIFFVATLLLTIGCGKSDNGSDTPTPPSTPSVETKMTTDMLLGTWQLVEYEIKGKKMSQSTDIEEAKSWQCNKQGTIAFSATVMKTTRYQYGLGNSCREDEFYDRYVIRDNKIYIFDDSNKEIYLFTVSALKDYLTMVREGEDGKVAYKKLSAEQPTFPLGKQATLEITMLGNTLDNVKIGIHQEISEHIFEEVAEGSLTNGKASFDVKKYIGKELHFVLKNKTTNEYVSERVKVTITEGKNTISLTYAPKVYTANITVTQNNAPLANQKVYALSVFEFNSLKAMTNFASSFTIFEQTVESTFKTKSITNSQGVAIFENLKPQFSNLSQYTFVVLTKTAPYYKSVELNMDGTAQSGTILLSESAQGGTTNGKTSVRFWLSGEKGEIILDATVQINGKTGYTNTNGMVMFEDMPENTNLEYTITTKKCKKITKGVHRTGKANTTTTVHLNTIDPEEGKMVIKNNSSNPYTVKIGSQSWVLEGKDSIILNGELNTEYTVSWKQNSGYLIYPTTGSKNIAFTCQERVINVSFP